MTFKKQKPLISVVMIFYNALPFFQEAIESILSQIYQNFELLLVDDGSNDGSTHIAHKYVNKYPENISYLEHHNHQNLGMSASRNLGISHAKGEYLALVDADDVSLPQRLEEQVNILENYPTVGMLYAGLESWYGWTGKDTDEKRDYFSYPPASPNSLIKPPRVFSLFLSKKYAAINAGLLRLSVVKEVGGYENTFKGINEDQVFFVKLCLHTNIYVVDKCWYKYRQHPQSSVFLNINKEDKGFQERKKFLAWVKQYLKQQKIKDWQVWLAFFKEELLCTHISLYLLPRLASNRLRFQYIIDLFLNR